MKFKSKEREGGFKYKRLTTDFMQNRKNQSGSDRDPYIAPNIKLYSAASGDNAIRILPATWEGGSYGHEVFVHYGIGSERTTYLCIKAMKGENCPVCNEKVKAEKEGDDDYSASLRTSKRIGVFLIDRAKEGDGPKLWLMPFTLEREIAAQAINKKTGEVIQFIDPEEGYDLNFTKQGKEKTTKYVGVSFDREPSALSDDEDTASEWLEHIKENPIPDVLVYHDAKHIKKQFEGMASSEDDDEDEESDAPKRSKLLNKLKIRK